MSMKKPALSQNPTSANLICVLAQGAMLPNAGVDYSRANLQDLLAKPFMAD